MGLIESLRRLSAIKGRPFTVGERAEAAIAMSEAADALESARKDACVMKDALEMMAEQHRCGCGHPHCHNCERDRVCSAALAPKEVRNSI